MTRIKPLYWLAVPALVLTACSEVDVLAPEPSVAERAALMACSVDMRAATMTCKPVEVVSPEGVQADRIIGAQDVYIKLASTNTSYDGGAQTFQTDVTVQSLVDELLGTTDGSTVTGVKVFFHAGPTVTGGTGTASVSNADGTGTFTAANQPYFLYNEILDPYEISVAKTWIFAVQNTVTTFSFQVYVAATMINESATLLDKVWTGTNSTAWSEAANWQGGVVPDSGSTVAVPSDALLVSTNYPVLGGNVVVTGLRVGLGSTLDFGGFELMAYGNVDATGTMSNGTLKMAGSGAKLSGAVPALSVTGSTSLQGATRSTGPIVVTGTLTVTNKTLTVSIP
jgi:hypothetical protein